MGKVTLAVRVCPFTEREVRSDGACEPVVCVEDEHTISITNMKVATSGAGDSRLRVRRYHAEFCLDGSCSPDNPNYASQDRVYATLGRQVLETVRGGEARSACVLAYGQSATGKTHTMLGTPEQPGLVPRLCRDLAGAGQPITVSFLEIYNERVRDLLCEELPGPVGSGGCRGGGGFNSLPRRKGNTLKDLRVRQHPTKGPYVQNLRRVIVHGAEALCSLVWTGAARRRTAATRRNQVSSRSHAVLQLSVGTADLHLADLAGSEKAGSESSYRGRQKEGANINRSLVALSNVISALVCGGGGGGGGRYVPYRDSALTWLLKDCFTGGASTFIVATVSPSGACYGESASTLRWAARARQLPAGRRSNTSSASCEPRLRAQPALALGEQLATLKAALLKHHILFIPETGALVHDPTFWTLKVSTPIDQNEIEAASNEKMDSNKTSASDVNRFGSTASSITSTSSDHDDQHLKVQENIKNPIDNIFGPVLERTVSGHDLKVTAPLRNKRKQYRSHDVLPIITKPKVVTLSHSTSSQFDIPGTSNNNKCDNDEVISVLKEGDKQNEPKTHVPYQLENPRAEIVASVTERLYTKLKKNEESAASKVENVIEKKIMEPLHELKICTNARQRLMEMSQRAFRARRRIGIPAYTQTRISVTRMKNKSIEVQRDLEPYCIKYDSEHKYFNNVHTETHSITPRCKDAAVGSAVGSIYCRDVAIATDPIPSCNSRSVMTDELHKSESFTQTQLVPPPRKKKMSAFTKYLSPSDPRGVAEPNEDITNASIINISISQAYAAEAESLSDDSLDACTNNKPKSKNYMPPDLLSNHNSLDQDIKLVHINDIECHHANVESSKNVYKTEIDPSSDSVPRHLKHQSQNLTISTPLEIHAIRTEVNNYTNNHNRTTIENSVASSLEDFFSDNDERDSLLPRSSGDNKFESEDLKNIILGRNRDVYPYNIVISPTTPSLERSNHSGKKSVTFVEDVTIHPQKALVSIGTQTLDDRRWVKDHCRFVSSEDLSNIDCDYIDNMPPKIINDHPRLEHSCSLSHVNELMINRNSSIQCRRPLGARRTSTVSVPNLNCRNGYTPIFRSRSPSDLPPSYKTPSNKELLFNEDTDSVTATPVSSEHYDPSEDDCTQSSTSNNCQSNDRYDFLKNFKGKKQFFENEIKRVRDRWPKYDKGFNYSYVDLDKKILQSCDQLEISIARHEDYIRRLNRRRKIGYGDRTTCPLPSALPPPPPSVYLQKLIQVRRDLVNTTKLNNVDSFHSFHGFV